MKLYRQILLLTLTLLVFVSSTGISVGMHLCGGELRDLSPVILMICLGYSCVTKMFYTLYGYLMNYNLKDTIFRFSFGCWRL